VLWYAKASDDGANVIFVAVNMDPTVEHDSTVTVPIEPLGIAPSESYRMHELLSDRAYDWRGPRGYVRLFPNESPAQIFRLER